MSDDEGIIKEINEEIVAMTEILKAKRKAKRDQDAKVRKYQKMATLEIQKITEGKIMTMAETTNSIDTAFRKT